MSLVRFYPTRISNYSNDVDRLFNHFWGNGGETIQESATWHPHVDIAESKDGFQLTMELPGVSKKDLSIKVEDDVLRIDGERNRIQREGENYLREERRFGKFSRVFKINSDIDRDKVQAEFKDGLLTIQLHKLEAAKPREINIK